MVGASITWAPMLVVARQRRRLTDQAEAVGREPLAEELGGLADRVAVILVIEIELAVGVAESVGIDRPAELALADQRLGGCR